MTHRLESRVRKLEDVYSGPAALQITSIPATAGYEICDRLCREAVENGSAKPTDMFIFVRRFAEAA